MPDASGRLTVDDLRATGSNAYVAYLDNAGFTYNEIFDRLQRRYELAYPQSIAAAISSGYTAAISGRAIESLEENQRLRAGQFPAGSGTSGGFRYYVDVRFANATTGQQDSRRVTITSPVNLTREQIEEQAREAFAELTADEETRNRYQDLPAEPDPTGFRFLAVERSG